MVIDYWSGCNSLPRSNTIFHNVEIGGFEGVIDYTIYCNRLQLLKQEK